MGTGARARRWWLAAGVWLGVIYATLHPARAAAELLRRHGLLGPAVLLCLLGAGAGAAALVWRRRPGAATLATLALFAAIYVALLARMPRPEERLHFVEYGILALLIEKAWRSSAWTARRGLAGGASSALAAVLLTAACGWVDEAIQAWLPSRVYDLRDVAYNAAAGLLAVSAAAAVERAAAPR